MADLTPEQIAANEAQLKIEQETAELKAQSKKEALRDLSKELGINAFEPTELKAKFDEFNTWKDSQKSEQDKLQEALDAYKAKEAEWQSNKLKIESELEASKLGIHPDNIEDVLKLAGGDPAKLADVVKKYPIFKAEAGITIGLQNPLNDKTPSGMSEVEAYMAKDPKYRNYIKK